MSPVELGSPSQRPWIQVGAAGADRSALMRGGSGSGGTRCPNHDTPYSIDRAAAVAPASPPGFRSPGLAPPMRRRPSTASTDLGAADSLPARSEGARSPQHRSVTIITGDLGGSAGGPGSRRLPRPGIPTRRTARDGCGGRPGADRSRRGDGDRQQPDAAPRRGLANLTGMTPCPGYTPGMTPPWMPREPHAHGNQVSPSAVHEGQHAHHRGHESHRRHRRREHVQRAPWRVGTRPTLGVGNHFAGTTMAEQSITAITGVTSRAAVAANGAVTLDTNRRKLPRPRAAGSTLDLRRALEITSGAPDARTVERHTPSRVTATNPPAPTFTVTAGTLPAGLLLDGVTGTISGTPTTPGINLHHHRRQRA